MTDSPVSSRGDGMSDAAVTNGTGKPWAEWFALLDAAGATAWTHPEIARWLHDTHGVPGWWCQSVTVGFEQARGMRLPGQRADGSFEVSASKTLPLGQQEALDAVIMAVSAGIGAPASESRDAKFITARWKLGDRETLLASVGPAKAGRASVSLTHQRLADAAHVAPAKAAMRTWLAGLG